MSTFRGEWCADFVQYNVGDTVVFQGAYYVNIQAHKSQSDWPPSQTPALWKHTNAGSESHDAGQYEYGQGHLEPKPDRPPVQGGYTTNNGTSVSHEDTKKPWYDLEDHKKAEMLGGGLALGLAALGGAYYINHEKHKKSGEEEKNQAWGLQNWIMGARKHTAEFLHQGPTGPFTWIFFDALQGHQGLLRSLIKGGEANGEPWFIARAFHDGGLHPGKFRPGQDAIFGFAGESIQVKQYEVLIGQFNAVHWTRVSGKVKPHELQGSAVQGGHEQDGTPLFVARAEHHGEVIPGKASVYLNGACVTVGHKEVEVEHYEVLCRA